MCRFVLRVPILLGLEGNQKKRYHVGVFRHFYFDEVNRHPRVVEAGDSEPLLEQDDPEPRLGSSFEAPLAANWVLGQKAREPPSKMVVGGCCCFFLGGGLLF